MSQTEAAAVKQFERLPSDVLPVNYKVEIQPDLNAFTFKGKLEITAKVLYRLSSWHTEWIRMIHFCFHSYNNYYLYMEGILIP